MSKRNEPMIPRTWLGCWLWTFSDIRPQSFLWQGHILELDDKTCHLEVEIRARREG